MTYEEFLKKHSLTQENSVATRLEQRKKKKLSTVSDLLGGGTVFAGSSPEKKLADAKTALTGINGISRDSIVNANPTTYVNNTGRVLTRNDGGTAESRTAEAKQRLAAAKEANEKRQKENERLLAIDIDAKKYEIEQLKTERKSLQEKYRTADRRERNSAQMSDNLHRIDLRIDNITDEIAMAEKARRESSYATLSSNADYTEKSKATANLFATDDSGDALVALVRGNDQEKAEVLHDYINGADYAKEAIAKKDRTQSKYGDRYRKYGMMTNDEVSLYNYLYNTKGYEAATKYLSDIEGTLNARLGQQNANEMNDVQRATFGVEAGRDNFMSGIQQYFTDEVKPVSVTQTTGQAAREHLGKAGQFAYDFAQLAGNMAPSILLSAVTGSVGAALGSVSMGASAAGNAYAEMMRETGNRNKARTYAGLVGASESALSYALSGIGKLGGKAINATKLAKNIAAIDNIWARTAAQFAKSGISEGFEETLQEYLEPLFYSSIYGGDYEAPEVKDALRTFALAALSGGVFEGPSIVAGAVADSANQTAFVNDILEAVYKSDEGMLDRLISDSVAGNNGKKAQKIATALQEKIADGKEVSGADIRKLATPAAKHNKNRVTAENLEKNKVATANMLDSYIAKHRDSKKPKTGLETAKQEMERKTEGVRRADADTMLKNPYAIEALKEYGYDPAAKDKVSSVRAAITKMASENVTGEMAVDSAIARYTKEVASDSASVKAKPTEVTADTAETNVPTEAKFEPNMNTEENTEVIDNAEGNLHLRYGSERNDGANPSVQVPAMETGTGRDQSGEETADRPKDAGAASLSYTEEVDASTVVKGGQNRISLLKDGETKAIKEAKALGAKLGLDVVFFRGDNLKVIRKDKNGKDRLVTARAMLEGNKMYVRVDHPDFDAYQLARHEAAHDMINNKEIDVEKIRDRINEIFDPAEIEQIVDSYLELYYGSDMTAKQAWEEIVCDAMGDMNVFALFGIEENAPAVLESIKKTANETRTEKTRAPPKEKTDFSYASTKAETADKLRLDTAKQMLDSGTNSETVRKETGWFKGMDGKWRFEIDDSKMRYYPAGDARFTQDHAEYAEYQDLVDKFINGEITEAEHDRMMELRDTWVNERPRLRDRVSKGNATLENMISHDELFAAYPQLRDVKVKFAELGQNENGNYNPETNTITINAKNKNIENTLIHEIQHAVQAIEGLSPGTNVKPVSEDVKNRLYILKEEQKKVSADLEAIYKEIGFEEYSDSLMDKVWNEEITIEEAERLEEEFLAEKSRKGHLLYGYEKQLREMVADAIREESAPYDEYRNTAGEIEARDVANRRKLSSEERKNTRPDVDREDVVFADKSDRVNVGDVVILDDGKMYVLASRKVITGKTTAERRANIAKFFSDLLEVHSSIDIPTIDGSVLTITKKDTLKKARDAFKEVKKKKIKLSDDEFFVKLKANSHIDEILEVSMPTKGNPVPDTKGHSFAKDGFVYRKAYFMDFDGKYYELSISIGLNKQIATVYNVGRITESVPPAAKIIAVVGSKPLGGTHPADSIPQSAEKSTENAGKTDFSEELTTLSDLRKDNERLRKQLAHWRNEVKTTDKPTVRRDDVEKLSRRLVRDYHLTVSAEEVTNIIEPLANLLAKNEDVTWNQVRKIVEPAARQMIEGAEVLNDEAWKNYAELRSYLKDHKFTITADEASSIPDFMAWKKANQKYLSASIGKTNVDKIYSEMSDMWPEFFNGNRETNPADQLFQIVDTLERITPIYENPYDFNISAATEYLADDIMDSMISTDIRRVKTYADRANEKLKAAKQKRIDDLRKKTQSANARAMRDRIIRHSSKLYQDLGTIRKDRNIPEELRAPVAAVLDTINFESKHTVVEDENGRRHVAKKGVEGEPTKRTEKFKDLKAAYRELADKGQLVIDPNILGMKGDDGTLAEVIEMGNKRLDDMNVTELQKVWDVIRSMEQAITNWNKAFRAGKAETISSLANAMFDDNRHKEYRAEYKIGSTILKLLEVDNITPEAFFHRLGKVGDSLFRMLRNAQDEHIRILAETADNLEEIIDNENIRKLERSVYTVTLGGENVKMTATQLMELFALTNRPHALMHILTGGIRLDSMDVGKNKLLSHNEVIRNITEQELRAAFDKLTERQKTIAYALQKYTSTELSAHGNKASMEVYGVKKFTEENYWPIRTHNSEIYQEQATSSNEATSVENYGMTKQVKPDAKTSLRVGSLFDTFSNHAVQMATYSAYLAPMVDLNRVRNYKLDGVNILDTINRAVGRGDQGSNYLGDLMKDLSIGVAAKDTDITLGSKLVGNYKAASVAANLRVVSQQWTAGIRAADVIDPKYFINAKLPSKKKWDNVIKKYAPIAQWKDWGYFDVHTGRQIKDVFFHTDTALDKTKQAGMWLAGKMDTLTWGTIWNACETEIADTHKDLPRGTKAFYEKVAERFNEVIDHTQVVDGILQRSQIMRAPGWYTKLSTAFLAEPTKQVNMIASALYDLNNASGKAAKADAKKRLFRSSVTLAITGIINGTLGTALVDGLRDDDDEKNYWEKIISAATGLSGDEETFGDFAKAITSGNIFEQFNPLGMIPNVNKWWELARGLGGKDIDDAAIEGLTSAVRAVYKAMKGESKKSDSAVYLDLVGAVATLFGIPVSNLKREVLSATQTYVHEFGNSLVKYRYAKLMMNPSENKKAFLGMMYDAYKNDKDAYEIIRKDLLREGFTEEDLDGGIKSGIKTAFDLSGYVEDKAKKNNYLYSELEKLGGGKASNVMPDDMSPVITYKDVKDKEIAVQLDEKEYAKFQKDVGDKAFEILKNTVGGAKWKSMTNDEKKSSISYAYQIARAYGKQNASGYEADDKWLVKALEKAEHADEIVTYKAMRMSYDKNKDGKLNATERNAAINAIAKTEEEKRLLRMLS